MWQVCNVTVVNLQCLLPQEAKKVSIDQDLKNILSETPGRCVPYAVIEGLNQVSVLRIAFLLSKYNLYSLICSWWLKFTMHNYISHFYTGFIYCTLQVWWDRWRKLWTASLLIIVKASLKDWPWRRKRWCGIAPLISGKSDWLIFILFTR